MASTEFYILFSRIVAISFVGMVILTVIGFFFKKNNTVSPDGLTVLIPFKNDFSNVQLSIAHLKKVVPADRKIRILFLDDHSSDLPENYSEFETDDDRFIFKKAQQGIQGKKAVVRNAIQNMETEWILLLDVDTKPAAELFDQNFSWIRKGAKMILIPLRPMPVRGFIRAFFDLDFLSLHFTGLGSARLGIPVLSNAAALLISREAFLKTSGLRTDWNEPSGDDIFLMMAIQKLYGRAAIAVAPVFKSLCTVSFPDDFKSLWHQRLRWISKVNRVKNFPFQLYSWIVFLAQITILFGLVLAALKLLSEVSLFPIFFILISEVLLLSIACIFAERPKLLPAIVPAVFIYPFYLLGLIVSRIFVRPIWK